MYLIHNTSQVEGIYFLDIISSLHGFWPSLPNPLKKRQGTSKISETKLFSHKEYIKNITNIISVTIINVKTIEVIV